jgi:hypothetical protein
MLKRIHIGNIKQKNTSSKAKQRRKRKNNPMGQYSLFFYFPSMIKIEYFSTINMQKDIDMLRKLLRQTNDRIVNLEKLVIQSYALLEKNCATTPQEGRAPSENLKRFIHIHSRVSPYVYTNDARFPVIEKFVPWEVLV